MANMNTYTGHIFDPMHMTIEDVDTEDIAHALSLLCRGGGHIQYFYSVGQHSINCCKEAMARGYSKRVQLACLLHDASEAYISDIIRPVKVHLDNYLEIENQIMTVILRKYHIDDLSEEENYLWKDVDDSLLNYELKAMMAKEENRLIQNIYSEPDVSEKEWRSVEEEFIQLLQSYEK